MLKLEKGTFSIVPIQMMRGLPPLCQTVFMWICHHTNEEGICWPSLEVLADECASGHTSITEATNKLVELGYLIKKRRKNASCKYQVIIKSGTPDSGNPKIRECQIPGLGMPDSGVPECQIPAFPIIELKPIRTKTKKLKPIICAEDENFELFKREYPKRAGGQNWEAAMRQWKARIKEKIDPRDMIEGAKRYYKFNEFVGNLNTEYIKLPQTFIGRDKHFNEPWEIPSATTSNSKSRRTRAQATGDALWKSCKPTLDELYPKTS